MTPHPLHSMCTYLGTFPPEVPRALIETWLPEEGVVLDPFCGRGTTLVEAALADRPFVGLDLNPLAVAVSRAKMQSVHLDDVLFRLTELARSYEPTADVRSLSNDIQLIFHERTLLQLCYLREELAYDRPEDRFILGAILGIMHGKRRKDGTSAYLSIDMPNTFSMSPNYVREFIRENELEKPPVDVFGKLRERARWLLREGSLDMSRGRVEQGDATCLKEELGDIEEPDIAGIVTSPPYLGVLRYGAFNWIRLWFLGLKSREVDRRLDSTGSLDKYMSFIASFLLSAGWVLEPGSPLVMVVGDVEKNGRTLRLAELIWDELGEVVPFEDVDIVADEFDTDSKTTRIWGEEKKGQATPRDRILILRRE